MLIRVSHALKVAQRYGMEARRTNNHQEVLQKMVNSLAEALDADRVAFYALDAFGHLHVHTAISPDVLAESHVRNIPPEGPLATALETNGFVLVPDILQPKKDCYLLEENGVFRRIGFNLNRDVIEGYRIRHGNNFAAAGNEMSMVFGSLADRGKTYGAIKADCFLTGRSILQSGMEPEDLLNIVAILSNSATQSLDELAVRTELMKEHRRTQTMFDRARKFLMGSGHAFKGWLTTVKLHLQLAMRSPEDLKPHLLKALESVDKASVYATQYVSPVSSGQIDIKIERSPTNLRSILEPLEELGIEIKMDSSIPEQIETDGDKVLDIILGLLENAEKYKRPDQNIAIVNIGCRLIGNEIEISVTDQGRGLESKEQAEKIFEGYRFYPEIPGSGFGLNAFRYIAEKLGGKMWAESAGPGLGTTVTFSLPL